MEICIWIGIFLFYIPNFSSSTHYQIQETKGRIIFFSIFKTFKSSNNVQSLDFVRKCATYQNQNKNSFVNMSWQLTIYHQYLVVLSKELCF